MYKTSYEMAALILTIVCLAYSFTVRRRQYVVRGGFAIRLQSQHFMFLVLLVTNLLSAASSVGGAFLQEIASARVAFWQYLLHLIYFLSHTTLSASFALYIMNVNGITVGRSKRFFLLFFLPYALGELMVLTNSFTSFVFYMDDAYQYHRGSLVWVLYGIGALYTLLGMIYFFRYDQAISPSDRRGIGFAIGIGTLGILIQALYPDLQVELFYEALAFLLLMILLEERSGHIDLVTGLLNRVAFAEANRRLMQNRRHYTLVLLKLTNLELYTRLFAGREMEKLLIQIADWLTVEANDQEVFCYGHGCFAVIVQDPAPAADTLANKLLERFERDWTSGAMSFRLDASVAVLRVPEEISDQEQLEELLSSNYANREAGTRLFVAKDLEAFRQNRSMELALRYAIENNALQVWYQPVWSVEEQRTVAAEALLRIDDPYFQGVSPEVYIPVAEKSGLIREIGLFVFEDVCRFLKTSGAELPGLDYVELNLSAYQFLYDDLVARFEEIRGRYGVDHSRINIEITETASEQTAAGVREAILNLRELGYTFSLDDFGTGYSNLNRLITGAFLNVKIDKTLLWDADHNPDTQRLLDSLIHVIRTLGYNVVQEGVETPSQLNRVSASGCNLIQGYYFSRPLPEAEFIRYMKAEASEKRESAVGGKRN